MKKSYVKYTSSRPVSWCIGACPLSQSKCYLNEYCDQDENNKTGTPLPRGVLVRSTSYQALHSALARLYRIDDFSLERIGQGFFSEVFKARHLATGKLMVLKMNKLFSNRHNMLREVELMNRLHHPNILHYYGVCVHEGQVHALTQYINGGSLNVLLQDRRIELTWFRKISLSLDISKGMAYLHSRRVFHRDLTSKNILIKHTKENGRLILFAVIADFGLAAAIPQDKSVRLRQVGSPYWMAPEVIRGDWYDNRADAFSFGIITCEIIARCDADPDILPRTHNFGMHYLAFSRMCQSDCPPTFLEIAFQCCQNYPDSRPSFSELESLLSYLLADYRPVRSVRTQKNRAYHKRSLSDETCVLMSSPAKDDSINNSFDTTTENIVPVVLKRTPQEVLERLGAADPFFHASSATVNPFNKVKLPAKSQLIVQEGGRYCQSMPDLRMCRLTSVSSASSTQLASSDGSLCPEIQSNNSQCNCDQSFKKKECDYARKASLKQCPQDSYLSSIEGESPRSDGGGPGPPHHRRGSGESGFFSVEDVEKFGTPPELCLSNSELSTTSLVSTEDDDHSLHVQRSPSVVTDSSEDLSSVGCCLDQICDINSDFDQPFSSYSSADGSYSTDIKAIVEFFESGYGSLRSMSELERTRKMSVGSLRKDCLVPSLRSRFSSVSPSSYHHRTVNLLSKQQSLSSPSSKIFSTKEKGSLCRSRIDKKEKIRERPKLFITEGTVRAKRNIFESK